VEKYCATTVLLYHYFRRNPELMILNAYGLLSRESYHELETSGPIILHEGGGISVISYYLF